MGHITPAFRSRVAVLGPCLRLRHEYLVGARLGSSGRPDLHANLLVVGPLSQFKPVFRVTVTSDQEIEIRTIAIETDLSILARGDFNDDGLDDLLLLASSGATEGTWAGAQLYLLGRDAPGSVLRVRPGEKHVFHQPTVQISGAKANCDVGIKLGTNFYDMCSISTRGKGQPAFWSSSDSVVLAAFVARSGHVVFYAGIFRDSHGEVRAIINKDHLTLVGSALRH